MTTQYLSARYFVTLILVFLVFAPPIYSQGLTLVQKPRMDGTEVFGRDLDISGDVAVIGAPTDTHLKFGGSVFLYHRSGGAWTMEAHIERHNQDRNDSFGSAVAATTNRVIVGAPRSKLTSGVRRGGAYIFVRGDNGWSEEGHLEGPIRETGIDFGQAVDIDGTTAVVGAHDYESARGVAFIYEFDGSDWVQTARLTEPELEQGDEFGLAVAISGDYVMVGAPNADDDRGWVFIYKRSGPGWVRSAWIESESEHYVTPAEGPPQAASVSASEAASSSVKEDRPLYTFADQFGISLDADGALGVIGAPGHDFYDGHEHDEGAAYVVDLASGTILRKLRNEEGEKGDIITPQYVVGSSVAIHEGTVLAGATGAGITGMTGAVYIFGPDGKQSEMLVPDGIDYEVDFGAAVSIDDGCYWIGAPGVTEDYEVYGAVYSACGDSQTDFPDVSIDVTALRPKSLDPEQTAIDDAKETSVGVQTIVNIDNDDGDISYDNFDLNGVQGGDDELIPLPIRLEPSWLTGGTVEVETLTGSENVRLWTNDTKTGVYRTAYSLSMTEDFEPSGSGRVDTLWVEGIKAHAAQRGTTILVSLQSEEAGCSETCTDSIAVTVIGVKSQTWMGKSNGFSADGKHTSNELDADPIFSATKLRPKSKRVFPGGRFPDTGKEFDEVDLEIELTVAPVEPLTMYARSFDVDDPTSEPTIVDPNDAGSAGTYTGTTLSYTPENDNRGMPKAGTMQGENQDGIKEVVFGKGETTATIPFTTSLHPGDNYRVFVYSDKDFLNRLRNRDQDHAFAIVDESVEPGQRMLWEDTVAMNENTGEAQYSSDVLSVWRILHVELDHMADPPDNGGISGYITAVNTASNELVVDENLNDGSRLLAGPTPPTGPLDCTHLGEGKGRFHFGELTIPGLAPLRVAGNGPDFVRFESPVDVATLPVPFEAVGSGGETLEGTVVEFQEGGLQMRLSTAGGPVSVGDLASFQDGLIRFADGPASIISDIDSASGVVTVTALFIPFMLVDDDMNITPPTDPSLMAESFQKAFVKVEIDGGGNSAFNQSGLPFVRNAPVDDAGMFAMVNDSWQSGAFEEDTFWTVYLLTAFEFANCVQVGGRASGDGDPNPETIVYAISPPDGSTAAASIGTGGDITFMFRESERDGIEIQQRVQGNVTYSHPVTVVHEVGHQFGLHHSHEDVMKIGYIYVSTFSPISVQMIRSRVKSPGQ